MISDDDICVTTMLMMMIMQMMKMKNEDGDDDDNEDDDEDDDDGDDDDDVATFAILCYSDRARLVARQSVSCPRAPGYDCPKSAMRCWQCNLVYSHSFFFLIDTGAAMAASITRFRHTPYRA